MVVICFHFTTFAVLETAASRSLNRQNPLWFAFILLPLPYWKQRKVVLPPLFPVVICFHFTTFAVLETAHREGRFGWNALWFAFILLPLPYWKQRTTLKTEAECGCDLLSFYYLCRTGNSNGLPKKYLPMLWFAFILLPLPYWKQPPSFFQGAFASCDLLSFYYLCRTGNSTRYALTVKNTVVICFHFTTFAVLETANSDNPKVRDMLWFAFILLPLPYWKQRCRDRWERQKGCDLLSFYYLCRTGNSTYFIEYNTRFVVICFHFTTFAVLETARAPERWADFGCDLLSFYYLCRTGNSLRSACKVRDLLWFAFILLPLPYWKQQLVLRLIWYYVVICFHFTTFAVLETAWMGRKYRQRSLWFAFILLPLPYWKQRKIVSNNSYTSCDLLSFYYLCRTGNSWQTQANVQFSVVICFHFTTFAVLETASWR